MSSWTLATGIRLPACQFALLSLVLAPRLADLLIPFQIGCDWPLHLQVYWIPSVRS